MSTLFEQLGYNFTDTSGAVTDFSSDVVDNLSRLPPLLDDWQYDDLKNQDATVTNYLKNPTKNVTIQIIDSVTSILNVSSNVTNLSNVVTQCRNIVDHYLPGVGEFDPPVFVQGSSSKYIAHCDRISGIVQPNEDTALLPHYDLAIGIGKSLVYLIYQSDGVQNNAPIMGSFTSLLIESELQQKRQIILSYPSLIANSVTCTIGDEETVCSSNLSPTQITQITSNLNDIQNIFNGRRLHDENYYTNASAMLEKYEEMKRYKSPGQTEKDLFTDIIGTDRLKNNL
jgi:hypothetical protein